MTIRIEPIKAYGLTGNFHIVVIDKPTTLADILSHANTHFTKGYGEIHHVDSPCAQVIPRLDASSPRRAFASVFVKGVPIKETMNEYTTAKYLTHVNYLFGAKLYGSIVYAGKMYMFYKYDAHFTSNEVKIHEDHKQILTCIALMDLHSLNVLHGDFHTNNHGFRFYGKYIGPYIYDITDEQGGGVAITDRGVYSDEDGLRRFLQSKGIEGRLLDVAWRNSKEIRAARRCLEMDLSGKLAQLGLGQAFRNIQQLQGKIARRLRKQYDREKVTHVMSEELVELIHSKNSLLKQMIVDLHGIYQRAGNMAHYTPVMNNTAYNLNSRSR